MGRRTIIFMSLPCVPKEGMPQEPFPENEPMNRLNGIVSKHITGRPE